MRRFVKLITAIKGHLVKQSAITTFLLLLLFRPFDLQLQGQVEKVCVSLPSRKETFNKTSL